MQFCFVLLCFVLFCFVLFCFVLFCCWFVFNFIFACFVFVFVFVLFCFVFVCLFAFFFSFFFFFFFFEKIAKSLFFSLSFFKTTFSYKLNNIILRNVLTQLPFLNLNFAIIFHHFKHEYVSYHYQHK